MKHWTHLVGCGLAVAALATFTSLTTRAEPRIPDENKTGGFAIGCQADSFNHFTAET